MAPRTTEQRKGDVLQKLHEDVDLWVASASSDGAAYLIPLSFSWDGTRITLATPKESRTARNLARAGKVRLGLGPTRDVVMIEGPVTLIDRDAVDDEIAGAFAAHTKFDPRTLREEYVYMQIVPQTIQAWREADELEGRFIMRGGRWQVDAP